MSASTIISQAFGEDANLYTTVLGLEMAGESVSASQLRKAYYRQALKYHPDKQQNKALEEVESARLKFEAISVAYSILSDEDRRKVYDEDGEMDDNDELVSGSNSDVWKDYFTGLFGKVTTEDIDKFTETYKCSEEEEQDVLKYYTQFQGDLGKMLECVMCSEDIDKQRWVEDYIKPAIENGAVENYLDTVNKTLYSNPEDEYFDDNDDTESEEGNHTDATKKRKPASKSKSNVKSTAKSSKKKKNDGPSLDLIAAIQGRARGGAGNLIAELEARYSNHNKGKKKGKGSKIMDKDPIPDDEFERIQQRLGKKR